MEGRKPINIIFLNVDRILSTSRVRYSFLNYPSDHNPYDPVIARFIDNVCSRHLCFIVVTSNTKNHSLSSYKSEMISRGGDCLSDFLLDDSELWTTTQNLDNKSTNNIINWFRAFIKKHGKTHVVENFLILDDKCSGRSDLDSRTVTVISSLDGMATEDFRRVVNKLEDFN